MTFWEALPQLADIGGLTLGLILSAAIVLGVFRLALPAAKYMQDTVLTVASRFMLLDSNITSLVLLGDGLRPLRILLQDLMTETAQTKKQRPHSRIRAAVH